MKPIEDDIDIVSWLLDNIGIHTEMPILNLRKFCEAIRGLQAISRDKDADKNAIVQRLNDIRLAVGPEVMEYMFDTPHDVDDFWVDHWCLQPAGTSLSSATCPPGTVPLWTNGEATIFLRRSQDKHGNPDFFFGIYDV